MSGVPSRVFIARLAGVAVFDPSGDQVGKVRDVVVTLRGTQQPRVLGLVVEVPPRRRIFVLQYVQPGLAGLMDGSVSTLAPLFAAAFATHQNWQTFLVGLAASIGAGISMGFAEALSDDGSLTGRGSPWLRGAASGVMTAIGGLGHSLPYLVPDSWSNAFWIATTIAGVVVFFELWAIAFIRSRYMDTPFLQAVFQIVLGGVIVLGVGILIGAA